MFEFLFGFEILFSLVFAFVSVVWTSNGVEIAVCAIGLADLDVDVVTVDLTIKNPFALKIKNKGTIFTEIYYCWI